MDQTTNPKTQALNNAAGALLALAIVGLLWFITYILAFCEIPQANATNLAQIIGAVCIQIGIMVGWYFRGSQNEKEQQKTISTMASSMAATQAATSPAPQVDPPKGDKT